MSTAKQVTLSLVIVLTAVAVVTFRLRSTGPMEASSESQGHDHAAISTGSGAMQPVALDAEAARRIGVTLATVEFRELPSVVRTVGTVVYDETRLATVNPKTEGWVERLHVDFTGAPVREGEPLMDVYSPALVTAQEELVLAVRRVRDAAEGRARDNANEMLRATRRRLSFWDIDDDEIARIEERGEPERTLTMRAPASGIVVEKNVDVGDRIMPGMTVYRIADLSRVWVEAEVFEKDLALVAEGQPGSVTFEAYPGRRFEGRVTYVHPTVSVQSRTARVRLELSNPGLDLKPGMYARVELHSMPRPSTLVVPRSAVIATGVRALVFVESEDGALLPREVVAGRTAGRFMEILDGLAVGERVVSSATFLVDAESNLGTMTGALDAAADGDMEGMGRSQMDGMAPPPDTTPGPGAHDGHGG